MLTALENDIVGTAIGAAIAPFVATAGRRPAGRRAVALANASRRTCGWRAPSSFMRGDIAMARQLTPAPASLDH